MYTMDHPDFYYTTVYYRNRKERTTAFKVDKHGMAGSEILVHKISW